MDNAIALVQAYLHINGYFTVTEYPIIEFFDEKHFQVATDIDVLACRFPHAGRLVTEHGRSAKKDQVITKLDPLLDIKTDAVDLIIAEVKERSATFNRRLFDTDVLSSAFMRFGCCMQCDAKKIVNQLAKTGRAKTQTGHDIRILVFGLSRHAHLKRRNYEIISLQHVKSFVEKYIQDHWNILRHAQFRDPGLGFLITLEKIRRSKESS